MSIDQVKTSKIIQTNSEQANTQTNSPEINQGQTFSDELQKAGTEKNNAADAAQALNLNLDETKENLKANLLGDLEMMQLNNLQSQGLSKSESIQGIKFENSFDFDYQELKRDDIVLFNSLSTGREISINTVSKDGLQANISIDGESNDVSYKSVEISGSLKDMVDKAYKTNQPVRISFDKDTSVILKVDKQGKVSAEFIPGDAAMERILRNSLPELRSKFDNEGLPYRELSYKQHNGQQNQQNQRNQKEADKDE